MNVIRHYARRVQFVLSMFMSMENALQNDVSFARTQLPAFVSREGNYVLCPRTFEVGKAAFSIKCVRGGFGEGAETSTRGACAPQSRPALVFGFNRARFAIAHRVCDCADVFGGCPATAANKIQPAVLGPLFQFWRERFRGFRKTGLGKRVGQT